MSNDLTANRLKNAQNADAFLQLLNKLVKRRGYTLEYDFERNQWRILGTSQTTAQTYDLAGVLNALGGE